MSTPEHAFPVERLRAEFPALQRAGSGVFFDNAAKVAKSAHANGTTLKEEAVRLGFVSAAEFDRLVQPDKMTHPG